MTIAHVWPGLTPAAVWDLPFVDWVQFAMAADEWNEQQKKR